MNIKEYLEAQKSKRSADLEALAERVAALEAKNAESEDEEELKAAGAELDELNAKKAELEKELEEINAQIAELDKPADDGQRSNNFNFMKRESRGVNGMTHEERKAKAEEFVKRGVMKIGCEETRAMLVSSGTIAAPTGVNETINELNKVSASIVDLVNVQDCGGMVGNIIPYEYTAPEGGVTVEGETYNEGETVTAFVETKPTKVTTISYISEETRKLTPVAYEALVKKNAMYALRKKVAKIIIDKIVASDLSVAKSGITKIDASTLRTIALSYGGEDEVEGNAIIGLNKATLAAFGDVRGTNEKKVIYDITPDASNPNIGVIKEGGVSVTYVLNSNIGNNQIVYGQPKKFELDLYSEYEVKVSEDFKFDKGLLTVRGSVMLDGDVTFKDGFIVATIG